MIALLGVGDGEGAFGGLFIARHEADRRVSAVGGDDTCDGIRINAGEVVIIVRLLIPLMAERASRQVVENPILLHKGGIGSSTVTDRPVVIIEADGPGEHWRRKGIKLDIVDTHPLAATVPAVIDSFKGYDVIEARANLGVHTGQSEWRCGVIHIQLCGADNNLRLNQHAIEIDFDAILGIGILRPVIQIVRVERDQELVTGF